MLSSSHKDIGSMYLVFGCLSGMLGMTFSLFIRLELAHPGSQLFTSGQYYNVVITAHALIMIFFMLMPILLGAFGN